MQIYLFAILIIISISSCTKNAIDYQDISNYDISINQSKLIYRECKDFPDGTKLAIALINNNKVIYYGVNRKNDSLFSYRNNEKIFHIGSLSKIFTSTLLADVIVNTEIELNDEIQKYLSFSIKNNPKITFQQLANHTSGIPKMPSNIGLWKTNWQNPYKNYDKALLREYLSEIMNLNHQPGEQFNYSNTGFALLGVLLSDITQLPYDELLQLKICNRYNLSHTTTNMYENTSVETNQLEDKRITWGLDIMTPAGGLISSVSDLSNFVLAHFDTNNEVLGLTRRHTYYSYKNGQRFNVGLGLMSKEKDGKEFYWHNGGTPVSTSIVQFNVKNKTGVIILSNVSGISKKRVNVESLGNRLMETLGE